MKKEGYFESIVKVDKRVNMINSQVELTALDTNGRKTIVEFRIGCHADEVIVYSVGLTNVKRKLSPRDIKGRLIVNRNNTMISVNELICQFWKMSFGSSPKHGEFNHHIPVCWSREAGGEVFSPLSGEIWSPQQNKAHWNCLSRIHQETGYKCAMFTYSQGYSILSNENISREQVELYDKLGYLFILSDDGPPKPKPKRNKNKVRNKTQVH